MEIVEEYRQVVIDGVEYPYQVSDIGNVRRIGSDKCLKPGKDKGRYLIVNLCFNGSPKTYIVHRLVAIAFIENTANKPQVDHIDNNKCNNRVENLRWSTNKENTRNKGKTKTNTSGFKGVTFYKVSNMFRAQIRIDGKLKHLGCFNTAEDAFEVYKTKAIEFHGEFAKW